MFAFLGNTLISLDMIRNVEFKPERNKAWVQYRGGNTSAEAVESITKEDWDEFRRQVQLYQPRVETE